MKTRKIYLNTEISIHIVYFLTKHPHKVLRKSSESLQKGLKNSSISPWKVLNKSPQKVLKKSAESPQRVLKKSSESGLENQ